MSIDEQNPAWLPFGFGEEDASLPRLNETRDPEIDAQPIGTVFLDAETTGLGYGSKLVEVAIIADDGRILLDTLVNPSGPIPAGASEIHGITDMMVADAPAAAEVQARVAEIVRGKRVVIYNAAFDRRYLDLGSAAAVECCMLAYAVIAGEWSDYHGGYRWQPLSTAARHVRHQWTGALHRALADAQACRSVWLALPRLREEQRARKEQERRDAEQRALEHAAEGWYTVERVARETDKAARRRAESNVAGQRKRRCARVCQAVRAFGSLIRQVEPVAPRKRFPGPQLWQVPEIGREYPVPFRPYGKPRVRSSFWKVG